MTPSKTLDIVLLITIIFVISTQWLTISELRKENAAHEYRMETLLRWLEGEGLLVPEDELDLHAPSPQDPPKPQYNNA